VNVTSWNPLKERNQKRNGAFAMTRRIVMAVVMAFAVGFVGCRACLAPYDCCQPTFLPERGDQCMGELYRCGSILGGVDHTSNANGYCESCGGGNVEYYSASEFGGTATTANVSDETQFASAGSATQIPSEFGNDSRYVARQTSFNASNVSGDFSNASGFALNDDSSETY